MLQVQDALIRFALEEMVANDKYPLHMERISENTRRLRERVQAKDIRGTLRAMIRYHELIVDASGNEYLKNVTRRHYLYHYERHVRDLATLDQLERAVEPYEKATQALLQRDGAGAYQCMRFKNYGFIAGLAGESSPLPVEPSSPAPSTADAPSNRKRKSAHV
ncbi:MAG: FCD domain-containing protein [Steroidobacteraceae bacterium]